MKIAYFSPPSPFGLYSVFRSLRDAVRPHGIEVRWVSAWEAAESYLPGERFEAEEQYGEMLRGAEPHPRPVAEQGRAIIRHVLERGYDGVVINPPQRAVEMNVARYLPPSVLRLMIVHTIAPGAYALCRGLREHVHATVTISPRGRKDLIAGHGFAPDRTHTIPTGIDMGPFRAAGRAPTDGAGPLRLVSFGRIDDSTKGVFTLPPLMDRVADADVHLTVAGDGEDLPELRRRCAHLGRRVSFVGRVLTRDVPGFLSGHDVFLMPSRTEGLGLALIEAMAAGCVPVASRIRDVTDFVIDEGRTGHLVGIGDVGATADAVRRLARDRAAVARQSAAAREDVLARFDLGPMGGRYAELLKSLAASPPPVAPPLPEGTWVYPRGFKPGLQRYIPKRLKDLVRRWRESA